MAKLLIFIIHIYVARGFLASPCAEQPHMAQLPPYSDVPFSVEVLLRSILASISFFSFIASS